MIDLDTEMDPNAAPPASPDKSADSVVSSWAGSRIRELVRSPELRRLYERWMTQIEKKLPRLNEFVGPSQKVELNDALLSVRLPNDFAFVHHGPSAVRAIGVDLTGLLLSERATAIGKAVLKVYTKCADVGEPFYFYHDATDASNRHFFVEHIVLPLAADARRQVGFILDYSAPLDDKGDVLRVIFAHSRTAMIAAASSHDDSGKLQDGRILLINERARLLLKLPESMARLSTVRDIGPWLRDGASWTKIDQKREGGQTHIYYRARESGIGYRVSIETIERFVLFSIVEVSVPQ